MNILKKQRLLATLLATTLLCSGCAVVAVADAVVTAGATVVKTGFKVTGAVIDAVIPDSKEAKK
jgi:PBP1b-binding outer membrane lipoprotein LpoB